MKLKFDAVVVRKVVKKNMPALIIIIGCSLFIYYSQSFFALSSPFRFKFFLNVFHDSNSNNKQLSSFFEQDSYKKFTNNYRWLPIHEAINQKNVSLLEMLLKQDNALVYEVDHEGRTALHHAALGGFFKGITLLIAHGASINQRDSLGCTPLHLASGRHQLLGETEKNYGRVIVFLIQAGAMLDIPDNFGRTALHYCAAGGYAYLANILIRAGAETNVYDNLHATPLHYAAGKDGLLWGEKDNYFMLGSELVTCGALLDVLDGEGKSPLHHAAACGHDRLAAFLINHHADIHVQDLQGATPLHYACGKDTARFMPRKYGSHVKSVLQIKDYEQTYLKEQQAHARLAALLLKNEASHEVKDNFYKKPFDYAYQYKHKEICNEFCIYLNR